MSVIQFSPLSAHPSHTPLAPAPAAEPAALIAECADEIDHLDQDFESLGALWREFKAALLAEFPEG